MAFEAFINRDFRGSSLEIIERANEIIDEYMQKGFRLTLRQLYYQFVARALIPNKQSEYKRLGSIINDARLAGAIDWDAIEDRTRNVRKLPMWEDESSILESVAHQYREDPWIFQDYKPEVWIEKDALVGVIEPVCRRMRVPYFACRGYTSQSEQYAAGKRFGDAQEKGYTPIVFHLGDHDPSGIDMTRDNADRLSLFAGHKVRVKRLALNMAQIRRYNPPPNPAKETDARFSSYQDIHGDQSWELDALDPMVIDALVQAAIDELIDRDRWEAAMTKEAEARTRLDKLAKNWTARVSDFVDSL